ncbi:MAG: sulfotransferase family protein [Bacteroidota bacterium]
MIINLISGPRNLSTALMYSFARHSNVKVIDEPFYAYYLVQTGINHPGREETIRSMYTDPVLVLDQISKLEAQHKIVFLKNMAQHHIGLDWTYLDKMKNVFLIRDPRQLIASFAQVIHEPTLQDIGLKEASELLSYAIKKGLKAPIVIDSANLLLHPHRELEKLCSHLDISFEPTMLKWEKGAIPEDGIWAKYWYGNVHNSTGFSRQETSKRDLPSHCQALYEKALPYYEKLKKHA